VLQSVRGVTVGESSSRASLYMTTLSSALIAYGFLADTDVAPAYLGVVLPIVFLLGAFTWERLVQTALEDIIALGGIQRIRRYYATPLPGADHFFPQPVDRTGVNELLDIGTRTTWRSLVFTTSSAVLTVNCIVGGTGVAGSPLCERPARRPPRLPSPLSSDEHARPCSPPSPSRSRQPPSPAGCPSPQARSASTSPCCSTAA
jgi:hypothetical protein